MCTNLGLLQKKLCFTVICWSGRTRFVRFLLVELRYSFYTFNRVQEVGTKMGKPGIQADMRFVSQSVSWLLFLHTRLDLCLCHAIRPTVVIMSLAVLCSCDFCFDSRPTYWTSWICLFQLILPECMKLLPLYTNCILKNDILLGGKFLSCKIVKICSLFFVQFLVWSCTWNLNFLKSHWTTSVSRPQLKHMQCCYVERCFCCHLLL